MNFADTLIRRLSPHSGLGLAGVSLKLGPNELRQSILGAGAAFLSLGLRAGDRVLIGCQLSPMPAVSILGAMHAGLVAVPVDEAQLTNQAEMFLKSAGAKAIWVEQEATVARLSATGVPVSHGLRSSQANAAVPRQLGDLAALMTTSGSTGTPRLVKVTHGNLLANTIAIAESQRLTELDRALLILPASYCFGASVLFSHLFSGGSVIFDSRFMFPDKVLKAISEFQCTTFAGVPSVYQILLKRSNLGTIPMPSLRRLLQAGGALPVDLVQEICRRLPLVDFYVMYGQTEATARISCLPPEMLDCKLGSVGRPLPNLEVAIRDDSGRPLAANTSGRIYIKGPSVSPGYWDESERDHEVFVDGWLDTRDTGHLDDDGYLWIEGRDGDFVKIRGRRIAYGEIETKVRSIEGVQDAAACAVPHHEAGEAPALFVVPHREADRDEVLQRVQKGIPPAWTCEQIQAIAQLPLNTRGKLDRQVLASLLQEAHE